MKKKGLVYRATMLFGATLIFVQLGGELVYAKYFKAGRNEVIEKVRTENSLNPDILKRTKSCIDQGRGE